MTVVVRLRPQIGVHNHHGERITVELRSSEPWRMGACPSHQLTHDDAVCSSFAGKGCRGSIFRETAFRFLVLTGIGEAGHRDAPGAWA